MSDDRNRWICSHWVESHEERHGKRRVFRHHTHPFPPSRGRFGFELREDGSAQKLMPGSADRPDASRASWTLEGSTLRVSDASGEDVYEVIEIDKDKLVVEAQERT